MPPKRILRKSATSSSSKKASSSLKKVSNGSPITEQPVCDGCSSAISTEESLQCSHCNAWLHRYCAGVPLRHYSSLASSPFMCIVCSQRENEKARATLHDEISALKAELSEVKAALVLLQQKSSTSAEATATRNVNARATYSESLKTNRSRSHPATRLQRPSPAAIPRSTMVSDAERTTSRPQRQRGSLSTTKVPVEGARRIWGAYKVCTPAAIQSAISKLTSIKTMQSPGEKKNQGPTR